MTTTGSSKPRRRPGSSGPTGPAIRAHELTKTYRAGKRTVRALAGVSFDVAPGTVFGLLGPNGAGKSTTVKLLTTLAVPDSGSGSVAGHDLLSQPRRVRRSIGVVAQSGGSDLQATGFENLVLQGRLHSMRGRQLAARARDLLDRFDLAEAANRQVRTYSGGMQRRLDVALGLVHRPEVLFLDEPTTGLDPEARATMWSEIRTLADNGLTVLLTTHYMEEADQLADQLAIVDRGRIVARGTPEELRSALRGDTVRLDFAVETVRRVGAARLCQVLDAVPGIGEVTVEGEGTSLSARAENGAAAVPAVLAALSEAAAPATAVTVSRPSLDDVYLLHVGHRLSDERWPDRETDLDVSRGTEAANGATTSEVSR